MAELDRVRTWAHALIDLHLDPSWSFAFDNARTRAGLCNYTAKRISGVPIRNAGHACDQALDALVEQILDIGGQLGDVAIGVGRENLDVGIDLGLVLHRRIHADEIGAAERQVDHADLDFFLVRGPHAAGRECCCGQCRDSEDFQLSDNIHDFLPLKNQSFGDYAFLRRASTATRMMRPFKSSW